MFTTVIFLTVLRPITHDASEPERDVVGTIEAMHWDARSRDVRIRLKGDACRYYINRGLDMGMDSTSWDKALTNQKSPCRSWTVQRASTGLAMSGQCGA